MGLEMLYLTLKFYGFLSKVFRAGETSEAVYRQEA